MDIRQLDTRGAGPRRVRPWLILCAMAPMVLLATQPAEAHSLTFKTAKTETPCVNSFTTKTTTLYANAEPTHETWTIRMMIGLDGGDNIQKVWFDFYLIDLDISAEVARYRGNADDWIEADADVFASTFHAHIGGNFKLEVTIHNEDPSDQCFFVWARAARE